MTDLSEQAALLALTEVATIPWHEVADLVEQAGGAQAIVDRSYAFDEGVPQYRLAEALAERTSDAMVDQWRSTISMHLAGPSAVQLITVLDDDYPTNLRRVYNRPPFLFVRGGLTEADSRSVAVVGTRQASASGRMHARELATALAERGVTVVSGMARGIDTEAHTAALEAGGRTIAVMGTGIDRAYPAENAGLAERIAASGALVSQFWPGTPPRRQNFPLRNVVTSGIAVGTVVIEASSTSGAKMQARLALEHGKRLFLLEDLVMHEDWAKKYSQRRGALVVKSIDDVLTVLDAEREVVTELQLF